MFVAIPFRFLGRLGPFLFLCLVAMSHARSTTAAESIEIVAGEPQLFVDDYLIASSHGLVRTLHQPKKDDGGNVPVIELADEFGVFTATLEANGSIVYDPRLKKYVMFALGFSAQNRDWDRARLFRFTSPDGLNWNKGDDGRPQVVYPHCYSSFGKNWARGVRVSGGGVVRARLRPEGYVSVDSGSLVAPPLKLPASELYVNSSGQVRVAALSASGEELVAAELTDDSLSHHVRFSGVELQ